jgi:hypothetical protein
MLVFLLFPLSPLPGVPTWEHFPFFFFSCPIFDAMFSRHDIIPPPPHASAVEAGVSVASWALGRFRSIWFGSGRYLEQFTDTTTGVCEGFFTLFHGSLLLFPLYDSIPSVTRCQKCTNLAGCLLLEMAKAILGFCCIRSNISLIVLCPWNQSEAIILSRADIWSDGMPGWLENITAIFASFLLLFL